MNYARLTYRSLVTRAGMMALTLGIGGPAAAAEISWFSPGSLVVSTVSNQSGRANVNALDTASTIVLNEYSLNTGGTIASLLGTLTLPQTVNGDNAPISGEYGSASEGILQRSANGQYLTMMGYGVNANTFNTAPVTTYGNAALGQSTSLTAANQTGTVVTTVPRVVALIGAAATVDTTTQLTGVFNKNNPRSAATIDGSSFYVGGQGGSTGDGTGGVFYATRGATTATIINNGTTTPSGNPNGTATASVGTDVRVVSIVNTGSGNVLEASRDVKVSGTPNDTTDIRSFTAPGGGLPTSGSGLVVTRLTPNTNSTGGTNTGSIDLTAGTVNGVNNARFTGSGNHFVYLSPEQYFYANATTLYIADSGAPKNGGANAAGFGEGGLQKWSMNTNTGFWSLDYDLVSGLNLVNNANAGTGGITANGITGLFGLTGVVVGNNVQLYATSYGLNELSQSYLYGITDSLGATLASQVASETFSVLATDTTGTVQFRGLAFAPVPEPASLVIFGTGLLGTAAARRRAKRG